MKSLKYLSLSVLICGCISLFLSSNAEVTPLPTRGFPPFVEKVSAEDAGGEIEDALYTKQEFFGAWAIVPLPTVEARENLARLAENEPDNRQILEKLAELNEKLSRFAESEKILIHLAKIDFSENETLAAFYDRRAEFEREAEVLRKILFSANAEKRAATFEKLIDLARVHDLQIYLQTDFYAAVAAENPNVYTVFERLVDNLAEEKNYAEALKFLRQANAQFPERASVLLEKEIEILLETNQAKEAEAVYQAAFNPLWTDAEADKFYEFLSNQDRLRAYGAELKARFKRNPADFDAGVRLALYRKHDYAYGNDEIAPVILKLEQAKKNWTTAELVTATRLLLKENEPDSASRFLYTLYLRDDFKTNPEMRAKILYQLFEMFSDAENRRLPLTRGDLRFYEDVASADTNPGIATGILSLVFSDTNPRTRLEEQEARATKYFNRAAAYRVFLAYKEEFPNSNETAQMYLDIVRLYAATRETEIAEKTLSEFAARYENADDYAGVALKLADAFVAAKQPEKERETYEKILDYLGKQRTPFQMQTRDDAQSFDNFKFGAAAISVGDEKANRNDGINIPTTRKPASSFSSSGGNNYSYGGNEQDGVFRNYLTRKHSLVTYEEVLGKLVASLAGEKKTAEILELYSNEIAKHRDEEWLYEGRLTWLEQTDLTEEKLQIYKTALARFQSRGWQDKLARFFLREKRDDEFAAFSTALIGKLTDEETENYLAQFASAKMSGKEFERQLYVRLYERAHERFPHNIAFVEGLLKFYRTYDREKDWRQLCAAYYFESKEIRELFLDNLAEKGELRNYLQAARTNQNTIYELFRADASARLSDFENAVAAYRKLNEIYPSTPEFVERLLNFTRSFGQKNRENLAEAAAISKSQADFLPASAAYRTMSGEVSAELGDYENAREEWEKLISTARGDDEVYLDAATAYWDYFQYDDALRTIKILREKRGDDTLYAFETGAIFEAQHKEREAVGEYIKALDASDDEDGTQKEKAKKRLAKLAANNTNNTNENSAAKESVTGEKIERKPAENQLLKIIDAAFSVERAKRKDDSFLSLGYAEFLFKIKQNDKAASVLNRAVGRSRDKNFLEAARSVYSSEDAKAGEQTALKRLAETTESARSAIQFRLQLAGSYEENHNRARAKTVVSELVRKFPTNYGVLNESADFYSRLGYDDEAVAALQNALPKSRGRYRNALAHKLAGRLIRLDRLDDAERILMELHTRDKADTEVFDELARVFVRRNDAAKMRKTFAETVAALKETDADRRELDDRIADLRAPMIDAFTRLKDYKSAVEQHIEIINREPENEELTDDAIRYVKRYGGADTLVHYYQKTAAEAFKNYRWNVVLARIYEANNDAENAIKNYKTAIVNQPEMPELYLAVAAIEARRSDFGEALKNLDTVLELTNDAPEYVKKKIEILKRAGRFGEIEAETAKLPAENKPKIAVDQFAEAAKLENTEREKARELYKKAFDKLLENPLENDLKAADVSGYVRTIRDEEPLDRIDSRLWMLRGKLTAIADEDDSTDAGAARRRLSTLDGALVEAVGTIAETVATDEELANLHEDLSRRINETSGAGDRHQTVSLVQDLSRRAGFGDLEEAILLKKLNESFAASDRQVYLQNLVNFYNERGAYQKTFDALEKYGGDYLPLKAEAARLVGDKEKELEVLRIIYWKPEKIAASNDANVARYLEILRAENRDELKSLTEKSSRYQLQLINFLLGAGEAELAHAAIENAGLSQAWTVARNAETSLAFGEFGDDAECYFCDALQFGSIGEMIRQTPDKKRFLIGDDWFRLTREYGELLAEKEKSRVVASGNSFAEADRYLAAMTENQPNNAEEQFKLGVFYLERNQLKNAIEHLRLAIEAENLAVDDKSKSATLGAAYYKIGRRDYAEEIWARVLEDGEIQSASVYFKTLEKYGLSKEARAQMPPVIVKFLAGSDADNSPEFQNLIRSVAASFTDEAEKSAYFLQILRTRPTDTSLAEMIVKENLIAKSEQSEFYKLLINRSEKTSDYNYNFTSVAQRVWTKQDSESVYDEENDYKTEEPENKGFEHRKSYLALLVERHENAEAAGLIAEIEKDLSGRYACPDWLRLAKIRLQIRGGKFDSAEAERFVGITVSDSATNIKPPSVERFNDVSQVLKEEKRIAESARLSESFFARMLALEQFEAANFVGLARAFFQKGEIEKAVRVLQLMIEAGDEAKKETALAEIASLEAVKARTADAAKLSQTETVDSVNQQAEALKLAAEIAVEFGQRDAAIRFRRRLLETNPADANNRIELAKFLLQTGEKTDAANLLTKVINDRNSLRPARWQARMILVEAGENAEIPNLGFDSFSQFYNGLFAVKSGHASAAIEFFTNSLVADKDAETSARQELVKLYASTDRPFAALKLAATDKAARSDQLLQTLSEAAQKIGDFQEAIEFERAKSNGGSAEKIANLQNALDGKNRRATDFTVDLENTRKL